MHNELTNGICSNRHNIIVKRNTKSQNTIIYNGASIKINIDNLIKSFLQSTNYISKIISSSLDYLKKEFTEQDLISFLTNILFLKSETDINKTIHCFSAEYIKFVKQRFQDSYKYDKYLDNFIGNKNKGIKIIWGDCLNVLTKLKNESIHLMVTSPPYYNVREYSHWINLEEYLTNMKNIIKECYRVLDNHRVFVFNIGDIFDNDNLKFKSIWAKRRIPLSVYFIKIFEDIGFTFVDDFIWDKGEVQSERHKNGNKPYPFYQYPMNCYEHILIFHKHRDDKTKYPCPICGSLKVNSNSYSEIGLRSWECKNNDCFERSKCNRGKRFSLKTLFTQSNQGKDFEISNNLLKKWRRDIVKFQPVFKINSKGKNILGHSAPFPEDIPEFAINFFSYQNDIVLDPFAGSFTVPIVANRLNRNGVGIELNKNMFKESIINNISNKLDNPIIDEIDLL